MEYIINNFKSLESRLKNENTIVFIKSQTCGVCDVIYPMILNIADKYNINIVKIYLEDFKEFGGQYMVFTVPTVLIFNYNKEMLRESRFINQNKIDSYFKKKSELSS